ncbi:beta-adaptin, putative, partial [Trypanosoma cruzi marinkellei]
MRPHSVENVIFFSFSCLSVFFYVCLSFFLFFPLLS